MMPVSAIALGFIVGALSGVTVRDPDEAGVDRQSPCGCLRPPR